MMHAEGFKCLPAARLAELLGSLPPDSLVATNTVENLMILSPVDVYMGFIDFESEQVEMIQYEDVDDD
ncbi:hypothetical protein DFO50_109120 [Microvirgula sp. AG722]|uniref:hypothetical protein n=1 Tax=Microvirgula sp. AG722 TaxID=2183901 RepID=UPI000DC58A21|nr:hypothetical protein [Microvirgula sp. AG722]RAS14865.1 hypothetical protein DFO50_109120 [Microvirgula sp. AG722]